MALCLMTAGLPELSASKELRASFGEVVRPYDLYDPRFCHLTPRPFICERCLKSDQQFVQRLRFDPADGRPIRSYGCRPYAKRYMN